MAVEIRKRVNRRIFPDHYSLRIALHRSGHGHERLARGDRLQNFVRGAHAKLSLSYGHLFLHVYIGTARLDVDIETLVPVITLQQRGIKTSVLRLWVPVGLQDNLRQSSLGWRMPAALNEEACDEEKAADAGNKLAHTLIQNTVQIF